VNRTDPQRFNSALMGGIYDPSGGDPVLAGQVVPLREFQEGEYRLAVLISDLVSGKSITRDVHFRSGHSWTDGGRAMQCLNRVLASIVASIAGMVSASATALAQSPASSQSVRALKGSIAGIVSDERGGPVAGALVSALGTTSGIAYSDASGWFQITALPVGEYTIQAHLKGFAGSPRATVRVNLLPPEVQRLQLRRLEGAPVATSGSATPVAGRPIMAAGFGLPGATLADQPEGEKSADAGERKDHPHTETVWRLRHLPRSILKSESDIIAVVEHDPGISSNSLFGRAMGSAASLATTFFTDSVLGRGQPADDQRVLVRRSCSLVTCCREAWRFSIGAPTPAGNWTARGAMSQGDLSSWNVAGSFASRKQPAWCEFGMSYSAGLSRR
jgi:hypothetical protein